MNNISKNNMKINKIKILLLISFVCFVNFVLVDNVYALTEDLAISVASTTATSSIQISSTTPTAILENTTETIASSTEMIKGPFHFIFTRALYRGLSGEDVRILQEYLKQFSEYYPEGFVTGYFGTLTKEAVKKFQTAKGIESVGAVGKKTMEVLKDETFFNNLSIVINRELKIGSSGEDVRILQEYLKQFPEYYPAGLVTGYFGTLTKEAIKKMQLEKNIEEFGNVGENTKKVLEKILQDKIEKISLLKLSILASSTESIIPSPLSTTTATSTVLTDLASTTATTTNAIATTTEPIKEEPQIIQAGAGPAIILPEVRVCDMTLPSGNQIYFVNTKNMPQIMQVNIDPLNALVGANQTITTKIRDTNSNPIGSVKAKVYGDSGLQKTIDMSLSGGTDINGTWSGSWTVELSRCDNFVVKVEASSDSGQSNVEVTIK